MSRTLDRSATPERQDDASASNAPIRNGAPDTRSPGNLAGLVDHFHDIGRSDRTKRQRQTHWRRTLVAYTTPWFKTSRSQKPSTHDDIWRAVAAPESVLTVWCALPQTPDVWCRRCRARGVTPHQEHCFFRTILAAIGQRDEAGERSAAIHEPDGWSINVLHESIPFRRIAHRLCLRTCQAQPLVHPTRRSHRVRRLNPVTRKVRSPVRLKRLAPTTCTGAVQGRLRRQCKLPTWKSAPPFETVPSDDGTTRPCGASNKQTRERVKQPAHDLPPCDGRRALQNGAQPALSPQRRSGRHQCNSGIWHRC